MPGSACGRAKGLRRRPSTRQPDRVVSNGAAVSGTTSGDTSTATMLPVPARPHDVDRHVVQRPAVDEQLSGGVDRRVDAGQGQAGAHRGPQPPAFVDDLIGPVQVGGDAVGTQRQVLDRYEAEVERDLLEARPAAQERPGLQRVGVQQAQGGRAAQRGLVGVADDQLGQVQRRRRAQHARIRGDRGQPLRHGRREEQLQVQAVPTSAPWPPGRPGRQGDHPNPRLRAENRPSPHARSRPPGRSR